MRLVLSLLLLVIPVLSGCLDSTYTWEDSKRTSLSKMEKTASKTCTGTVQSVFEKPPAETGFACSLQECQSTHAVGSQIPYTCDGDRCPIKVGSSRGRASCTDSSGTSYLNACGVTFSAVTPCQ